MIEGKCISGILQVGEASGLMGAFTGDSDDRDQDRGEDADDGDDGEQFDKRETGTMSSASGAKIPAEVG
jgi:hypothetical protein